MLARGHPINWMFATRRADFSASHVCRLPDVSDEQNRRLFGKDANPHGHGHNFVVEVTVEGEPDPVTGMIIDLRVLKDLMETAVIQPMDHRFLNREVSPFDRVIPTTENIALEIWRRLEQPLANDHTRLANVRLYETPDLFVDVAADGRLA